MDELMGQVFSTRRIMRHPDHAPPYYILVSQDHVRDEDTYYVGSLSILTAELACGGAGMCRSNKLAIACLPALIARIADLNDEVMVVNNSFVIQHEEQVSGTTFQTHT
jgi:hypothetical protein